MPSLSETFWLLRKTWLTSARRSFYSQFGEDAVLMGMIPRQYRNGFYVDVGAYHPRKLSNTYAFHRRGWRGVNIDMEPIKVRAFALARPRDWNVCAAVSNTQETLTAYSYGRYDLGATIDAGQAAAAQLPVAQTRTVTTRTLDEILDASPFAGRQIDLLSIDVEGKDYEALASLDLARYSPKIIVIESLQARSLEGIASSRIHQHLTAAGYDLVSWVQLSLVYRHRSATFPY